MGLFTFIVLLGSIRKNLCLMLTFAMLCSTFLIFGSSRLYGAAGNENKRHSLHKVGSHFPSFHHECEGLTARIGSWGNGIRQLLHRLVSFGCGGSRDYRLPDTASRVRPLLVCPWSE